jgi:hypothetical protein
MKIEDRLHLNQGETINFVKKYETRASGSISRYFYNIIDSKGEKVGSVMYKEESGNNESGILHYTIKKFDHNDHLVFKTQWGYSATQKKKNNMDRQRGINKLKNVLKTVVQEKMKVELQEG